MARVAAALLAFGTDAKHQSGHLVLGGSAAPWQYIDKFGFQTGRSSVAFRVRLVDGANSTEDQTIPLLAYLDERWPEVDSTSDLCERDGMAKFSKHMQLPANGDWGAWNTRAVTQSVRPHIWYFAVSQSCSGAASERLIEYEFEALQPDGSHFSVEMRRMLALNTASLLLFSGFLGCFARRCWSCLQQNGAVHSVVLALSLAMLLHFGSLLLHTAHLAVYAQDGQGIGALDLLHELLFMASQVVQTSLLILIALGYTLFHSSLEELSIVKPIVALIALVHAVLVACGKMNNGANKYHENEGLVGWVLLSIRLGLLCWFLAALQRSQAKGGYRLQSFLREFQFAGSLYFLAFPVIFLIVQLFAPYLQHPVLQTGLLAMQGASHFWLSNLFLSRGNYFKVSVLSASLLPGFGGGGDCKSS